ncbi:MAG: sulfite exporter TauE/SafE family protein [Rhodanobacter sp.]|jgi:uncharacterized membrane protein YfcA|nr:sulfite exporter TauE/SafE family protein [Rhodanobacter sp.]
MDALLHSHLAFAIGGVIVIAGLAHGIVGFGFPMISTPVVAMMVDMKTAILVTVLPNILVNLISILRGGKWYESLGKYWPMAIYVLIGTLLGTRILISADPEPLKLLLAVSIVLFLLQERIRRLDFSWISRYPKASGPLFGLMAGFLSGAVNVSVPPLVVYFMALGLAPIAMTQMLNLCFIAGKTTQLASLSASGHVDVASFVLTVPLALLAAGALGLGMRMQRNLTQEAYKFLLRKALWIMVAILVGQVVFHYLRAWPRLTSLT